MTSKTKTWGGAGAGVLLGGILAIAVLRSCGGTPPSPPVDLITAAYRWADAGAADAHPKADAASAPKPDAQAKPDAPKQATTAPAALAPQQQSPWRPGGKLTPAELKTWRALVNEQATRSVALEMKLEAFASRDPGAAAYDRLAAVEGAYERGHGLRVTVFVRRLAREHDLNIKCFVGIANTDQARQQCGAELWMFDGKTGDIGLYAMASK